MDQVKSVLENKQVMFGILLLIVFLLYQYFSQCKSNDSRIYNNVSRCHILQKKIFH